MLAALDLGSNSFRLEVGQVWQGRYRRRHCHKKMVSLGAGLDGRGLLSRDAIERGLHCLAAFAAELSALQPLQVRAVATQTLREARNRNLFLRRAEAVLGHPVEVISGHEEARLIYAGVAHLHPSTQRRLVIDIGGRSTELIVGQGRTTHRVESFRIGSASVSQRFFQGGRMTAGRFRAARQAVGEVLGDVLGNFGPEQWEEALGASGTAGMLSAVLRSSGITDGQLTPAGLRWLTQRCTEAGSVDQLTLPGLKPERRPLLPGGLAILQALMDLCHIETLHAAKGALRQGAIIDMHERGLDHQIAGLAEDSLIQEMLQRFNVDLAKSSRVAAVALDFHRQLRPDVPASGRHELGRAAALHELGRAVSDRRHHRHGAYLLSHAGTPGVAAEERQRLASLVLGQRGGLAKVAPALQDIDFAWQLLSLRLALIFCQESPADSTPPGLLLRSSGSQVRLALPDRKAGRSIQTVDSLRSEAGEWSKSGMLELCLDGV
jgi:exopolyphosphatase/guanosine-5'-triphosphate,3'-diphosphate pyrophosphatase